jgi:hypothetical protein
MPALLFFFAFQIAAAFLFRFSFSQMPFSFGEASADTRAHTYFAGGPYYGR